MSTLYPWCEYACIRKPNGDHHDSCPANPSPPDGPDKAPPRKPVSVEQAFKQLAEIGAKHNCAWELERWQSHWLDVHIAEHHAAYDAVVAEKQRHYEVALAQATRADQLVKERDEYVHEAEHFQNKCIDLDQALGIATKERDALTAQLSKQKLIAEVDQKRIEDLYTQNRALQAKVHEVNAQLASTQNELKAEHSLRTMDIKACMRLEHALAEAQENSVYKARVIRDAATRIERLERALAYAKEEMAKINGEDCTQLEVMASLEADE